jgi:F-type H+-transporting ATPase subunit b
MQRTTATIALLLASGPAWAGGGDYVSQTVNFVLLVILLAVVARKPIASGLRQRSESIEVSLETSQKALTEAQKKFDDIQVQLDNMSARIGEMEEEAKEEAKALQEEMRLKGVSDSKRLAQAADHAIRDELERSKKALKAEAVELAMEIAVETLDKKMVDSDHQRLSNDFVNHLRGEVQDV